MGAVNQLSAQHRLAQQAGMTGTGQSIPNSVPTDPVGQIAQYVTAPWGELQGLLSEFHIPQPTSSTIPQSPLGPNGGAGLTPPAPPSAPVPLADIPTKIKAWLGYGG